MFKKILLSEQFYGVTKRFYIFLLIVGLTSVCGNLYMPVNAEIFESPATHVHLVDFDTGTVLLSKNSNEAMAPASMTKMMTSYLLFERLKNGSLSLEDTFRVSEKAWRKGGSRMYVNVGTRVKVEDLLRGIIVQSGNDASIVVAEGLAGSEVAFVAEMNRVAEELGMFNTTFVNSSGWPHPEHLTTASDLAILAMATIRNFPDYYHYYSEKVFKYNGIKQYNRNPLLRKDFGVDGLKTGYTKNSGFGLVSSATRNSRRLILVVNGLQSDSSRSVVSEQLVDLGFREWDNYNLFQAGETVVVANTWLGSDKKVALVISEDMTITLRRRDRRDMEVKVLYDEPIPTPITKGTQIAKLVLSIPQLPPTEVPLVAGSDVSRLGLVGRLRSALGYLIWGEEAYQ